jgi:hypothetical protein
MGDSVTRTPMHHALIPTNTFLGGGGPHNSIKNKKWRIKNWEQRCFYDASKGDFDDSCLP